MEGISDAYALV